MEFKEIAQKRYATKKFDGTILDQSKVDELCELIRLSASSFGLQPWKVNIVKDKEIKEKLAPAAWNQDQITTCSHILVFCANTQVKDHIDKFEKMLEASGASEESRKTYVGMMRGFEEGMSDEHKLGWAQRQLYLAVANAINGAKALGFDSCPMEGFSEEEFSKILELPKHLVPTCLVTIGIASDVPKPKIRFAKEDLFWE